MGNAHVSTGEQHNREVLGLRWVWAPWDDGFVGPALERCPEPGEDAATHQLN